MKYADIAMYQAKQAGRNRYQLCKKAWRCDIIAVPVQSFSTFKW